MKILALDPATHYGFAYQDGNNAIVSGTWDLSSKRDESKGMKLIRLESKLNEIAKLGIDLIVFEAARNAMPQMQGALVVQAELQGVLKLWAEKNKLDYRGYSPSEIKKHATGKGNCGKPAMIAAAKKKFNFSGDDNEADALWVLDLAKSEYAKA